MTADVVVVGGGIGGAVLAGLLGRHGRHVVVLERNLRAPSWVRPEVLWPRSMDVVFSLDAAERWLERAAMPLHGIEFHDGRRVTPFFGSGSLDEARVQPWSTNPNQTREHLLGLGTFEVRRGVEAVAVLKDGDRVVGVRARNIATGEESDVMAGLTVGDDVAQSLVRRACGIELETSPRDASHRQFDAMLLGAFSVIALLLVAGGLASTLSYMVSLRRRTLGVRLALGATPRELQQRVLQRGLGLAAIGGVIGTYGASIRR